MNVRKRSVAWILGALLAPAIVQADETEPKPPMVQDVLEIVQEDGIAADASGPTGSVTITSDGPQGPAAIELALDGHIQKKMAEAESLGKYWLGLMCTAPSDALRTQLDLGSDVGLLVEEVYDDGPAKKSGLQVHDVLIATKVAGKDEARILKSLTDLINAVQAAETAALKVEFLRRGRKQTLEVVPAERPQPVVRRSVTTTADGNLTSVWMSSPDAVRLRWAGPMVLNLKAEPLPEGMSIDFQPAEGEPQRVTVKKGDQVWNADIKSLDKLPEEIAKLVKQHLQLRTARVGREIAYRARTDGNVSFVAQAVAPSLPEDVTVTVVRKGAAPMKVTIQKGDQTWDVNDKDLTTLPVEVRRYAEMALTGQLNGPAPFTKIITMPAMPTIPPMHGGESRPDKVTVAAPVPPRPTPKSVRVIDRPSQSQQDIERQLEELTEQVQRLRQAVEKTQPKQ